MNIERKLASIRKINNLQPIEGADRIEKATIDGWELVVKKGEFNINDLCVYFEIDSILPERKCFEFMRETKFRVKTRKFRGVYSQGLALPIHTIECEYKKLFPFAKEGYDLTDFLEVKKYDPQLLEENKLKEESSKVIKNPIIKLLCRFKLFRNIFIKKESFAFPSNLISKTDEERLQNMKSILEKEKDSIFYTSEKIDGCSSTFLNFKNKFKVCSRNLALKKDNSKYWKIAEKYNLQKILKNKNLAIQGEILGDKIQGNKYGISGFELYVFNIYDIDKKQYFNLNEMIEFCKENKLKTIPILNTNFKLSSSVEEMVNYSKGKSILNSKIQREGIVFRTLDMRVSFKVINPDFLLKFEE
jgi:hypothetical protein